MKDRIYNDYFLPERMDEYEKLLKSYLEKNYEFLCIKDYQKMKNNQKYIFIRHDIDSDVIYARKMFEVEKKLNIHTTYYFRLETLDKELIKEILDYGSEVGYHYEEIATFCKKNKKFNKDFIDKNLVKIQELFQKNINFIQEEYNIKLSSIASHGDFINRKINLTNQYLYTNELKNKLNLIEAYDIETNIEFRTSDCMYPKFFKEDPLKGLKENKKRVLLLIHTRYWGKNPCERIKLDFKRLIDAIKYH